MLVRKILIICLCLTVFLPITYAIRNATITTVPPITAQSPGVILNCTPLQATPGSVTLGSSGFIRVKCPTTAAISLGLNQPITLTPSLTLGLGYTNAAIILAGSSGAQPCDYNFSQLQVGTVFVTTGAFLNQSITFAGTPTSSDLLSGGYDYCLQYVNAPSTGLPGFNIVWT